MADARGTGKIPPLSTDESTTGVIEADSTATITWFEIRVSVRDTGVGISAENIKNLFQSVSHAAAPPRSHKHAGAWSDQERRLIRF